MADSNASKVKSVIDLGKEYGVTLDRALVTEHVNSDPNRRPKTHLKNLLKIIIGKVDGKSSEEALADPKKAPKPKKVWLTKARETKANEIVKICHDNGYGEVDQDEAIRYMKRFPRTAAYGIANKIAAKYQREWEREERAFFRSIRGSRSSFW